MGTAASVTFSRSVDASPLDDSQVGGVGWGGPTTGDLTAVYWNPGALGLLEGNQAMVSAGGRLVNTTIDRTAIDPATGQPGGPRSFASATERGVYQPAHWPPGPGSFVGIGADLGGRFVIALASYMPFAQRTKVSDDPAAQEATRFHLLEADIRNVALVPALAFRIGNDLRVGVAPGFLFSAGQVVFDEDTAADAGPAGLAADCGGQPCGVENPAAAARYKVASGLGPVSSSPSFTVGAGIHYRRDRWEFGLAYASRPFGNGGGSVEIDARQTSVLRPPRDSARGPLCPVNQPGECVFGHLSYRLPDVFTVGVTSHVTPRVELTGIARWMTWSRHDRIFLRVVGPATDGLRPAGLPDQITLYRGFRDTLDLRARATVAVLPRLRLAATLRAETSAVPAQALNPGAVDGFKIEPALAAQLRVGSTFLLAAGYALTLMPALDANPSVFDPAAATACQQAGGNLESPACRTRLAGAARPTAAGTYRQRGQAFSLTLTALF